MPLGEVERVGTVFRWRLREFPSLDHRVDSWYGSPFFSFCGRSWRLHLYPNGVTWRQSEGDVDLFLLVLDDGPPTRVRYSAGIVTVGGGTDGCVTDTWTLERPYTGVYIKVIRRSDVFRRRDELLPGDNLTLAVTLEVVDGSSETVLKDASVQTSVDTCDAGVPAQTPVEKSARGAGKGETSVKRVLKNASVQATVETNVAHESVQASVETCDAEVSVQTPVENNATGDERCETLEMRDFEKLREHFRLWLEHPEEGERIRRLRMEELEKREKREKVVKKQPPEKEWNFFAA